MYRSHKTRLYLGAAAIVGAGFLASSAGAVPGDIYNLGTLGRAESFGHAINDAGQVAIGTAYPIQKRS